MKITNVNYETQLSFEDVVNYIPKLTVDNEVITEGQIVRVELTLENDKKDNIFLDLATSEFCFNSKHDLYEVGGILQSHFFKHDSIEKFLDSKNMEQITLDILQEEV